MKVGCNDCDWKDEDYKLDDPEDEEDLPTCPDCGSDNIYYLNEDY